MKTPLCLTVSLWTLVLFSRLFEISEADCSGNYTLTTTTTNISISQPPDCNISIGGNPEATSKITGLVPGVVYNVSLNCSGCLKNQLATTKPEKVRDLNFTEVTTSSLMLRWTKPSGNIGEYRVNCSGNTTEGPDTFVNITGLTSGMQYTAEVTAVALDNVTIGETESLSQYTKPAKPVNITASSWTHRLRISWDLPEGSATSYKVNLNNSNLNKSEKTYNTSIIIPDLLPGRVYEVTVTAVAENFTNISEPASFATVPLPPESIIISETTNFSLHMNWGVNSQMEGAPNISYIITYQKNKDNNTKSNISMVNETMLSSLDSGTLYYVIVTTVGPQNLRSNGANTTACTNPNPVLDLVAFPLSNTSVKVTWSYPQDRKSDYTYEVLTYNNSGELIKNISVYSNNTTVNQLDPGTMYNITVFTVASVAPNCKSTQNEIFSFTKPNAVTNLTVAHVNTTAIQITWLRPSDHKSTYSYLVHALLDTDVVRNQSTNTESSTIYNLIPGKVYTLSVVTVVQGVHSEKQMTSGQTIPNPPGRIIVTSRTTHSVNFTWALPKDMQPDQYNFSVTSFNGTDSTQYNYYMLENLTSGSPYTITVATVAVNKYQSQNVTTEAYTKPNAVIELRQTQITNDTVTLEWNVTDLNYYSFLVDVRNCCVPVTSVNVTKLNYTVTELLSGTNYSFTVTTQTADGTQAFPNTVSYFTRPNIIEGLQTDTLNTTSVQLNWTNPLGYKPEYTYLVETSGCSAPKNQTLKENSVLISDLTPGTNCSFCVFVIAENGINGESYCRSQYTVPEKVSPRFCCQSNSSLMVSWEKPPGNVEYYTVYLNGTTTNLTSGTLDSSSFNYTFNNLPAGRCYTATVVTQSGPFSAVSEPITNATFPKTPGYIHILNKTTHSIEIKWEEAPLMMCTPFHYRLEITPGRVENTTRSDFKFDGLASGTSYNISVTTVGAMDLKSETVWYNMVTTRPFNVSSVQAFPNKDSVNLSWNKPMEYKDSYIYNLTIQFSNSNQNVFNTTRETYTFCQLDPGTSYNFTVTTETSDGTQGAPIQTSSCTNASPVQNLKCYTPNEENATITLLWDKPIGLYSNFMLNMVESPGISSTSSCCNYTFNNGLQHNTYYNLMVKTQSCGAASTAETIKCQTGITNPTIPGDYKSMVELVHKEFNMFTVAINASLMNNNNGPITQIGVLVTDDITGVKQLNMQQYLISTYDQWKQKKTPLYLATIKDNVRQSRSTTETLTISVGNGSTWKGYVNGALEATREYYYAIVLFTNLIVDNDLINGKTSLFSVTEFYFYVQLPQNPAVIGMAVGVTLGIFCVLMIILIGVIIYWRRLSNKETSDIQIPSIRSKVSIPVRVEDYEVYYKKQKADSNCGFAEEFEDLKVVGTAQAKTNALNPENKVKNRYNNVLPYDSSRVKLSIIHGNPFDDYINANYIPGYHSRKEFIAAQGPLPATVNDFWRMVWEKNIHTLVMLTRCNEQGRVKCEQYWTPGIRHFGKITVTTTSEIHLEDWTIRDFNIKNVKTAETRSVRHFHFTAWPDHGVPETTELLISFRHLVREHMDQYRNSPTVVHCSAGVGRTGTFITIDRLIYQIERENIVDIYGIVHDLRMHRSLMVQTEDQYVFLNQCAMDIIRSRTGTNVDLIYQNADAFAIYQNIEPRKAYSQKNFTNA